MATLDSIVADLGEKFGLGPQAGPLVREALQLITGGPGGISGFLDRFRSAGLGDQVTSWIGGTGNVPISRQAVETALGNPVVSGIAGRLGLSPAVIATALGAAIPRVLGLLTPGGKISDVLPSDIRSFMQAGPQAREQVRPMAMATVPDQMAKRRAWITPLIAGLAVLAAIGWWMSRPSGVSTPATAPPAATNTAAAQAQPRLWFTNDNGNVSYSGVVSDEATRAGIVDALRNTFGADKIHGAITIDPSVAATTPWADKLGTALASLKTDGASALFEGNTVSIGGLSDAARNTALTSLQSVLGTGVVIGSLADHVPDLIGASTGTAASALAALKPGFGAADVAASLNQAMVNFAPGSADIPAASSALLAQAAARMKELPSGTVIEIAAYSDNAGDPSSSLALSQQRADAIRNALVQAGVPAAMLVAKGYGQANPVTSDDTAIGRLRNQRIEFHPISG